MKTYNFKIRTLMSVWNDTEIQLKANNLKEAILRLNDPTVHEYEKSELLVESAEPICESQDEIVKLYWDNIYSDIKTSLEVGDPLIVKEFENEKDIIEVINFIDSRL